MLIVKLNMRRRKQQVLKSVSQILSILVITCIEDIVKNLLVGFNNCLRQLAILTYVADDVRALFKIN